MFLSTSPDVTDVSIMWPPSACCNELDRLLHIRWLETVKINKAVALEC